MENKIAVVLCGSEKEKTLKKVFSDVKWIEIRVDEFLKIFPEEKIIPYLKKIRENFHGNLIGTVRWAKEQGKEKTYINDTKRKEIYEKIIPYVNYLDIEIKSEITPEIVRLAKNKNKKIILSYHNFKKMPSAKELNGLCQKANLLNPDIFKLAIQINNPSEFLFLMGISIKWKQTVLIVPMGLPGIFRLIPLYYGSPFTYVFLNKASAPGQSSYETFKKIERCLLK